VAAIGNLFMEADIGFGIVRAPGDQRFYFQKEIFQLL
jgi:hypothetical protein